MSKCDKPVCLPAHCRHNDNDLMAFITGPCNLAGNVFYTFNAANGCTAEFLDYKHIIINQNVKNPAANCSESNQNLPSLDGREYQHINKPGSILYKNTAVYCISLIITHAGLCTFPAVIENKRDRLRGVCPDTYWRPVITKYKNPEMSL